MNNNRLMWWGESMYGGYYADIIVDEEHICLHAETQQGIREQLVAYGLPGTLKRELRWDN